MVGLESVDLPVSMVTSQYGDINKEISVFEEPKKISAFLKSYYGYHRENLGVVAFALFCFPLVFALGFAFFIAKLNFPEEVNNVHHSFLCNSIVLCLNFDKHSVSDLQFQFSKCI